MNKGKGKAVDYLSEDPSIPGQKFALNSFVSPKGNQKCDILGIKNRGNYATFEEADARAKALRDSDPDFDVFVSPVGLWVPMCPDSTKIQSVHHQDERLNDIVRGHKENELKTAEHFEERQRILSRQALKGGSKESQSILADKPLHPIVIKSNLHNTKETLAETRAHIDELQEQFDRLTEQETELSGMFSSLTIEDLEVIRVIEEKNKISEEEKTLDLLDVSLENKKLFDSDDVPLRGRDSVPVVRNTGV
jgi:hypothetical protein